jgi:translocator protein
VRCPGAAGEAGVMSNRLALLLFIVLVLGGGTLIGLTSAPGPWFEALNKPVFNPPNWIFAPVWSTLYVLIAIAGWRVWRLENAGPLMKIWVAQLVLNFLWSPVFFTMHQIGLALLVIICLLALIAVFVAVAWKRERFAAWLFVPYLAWVAFATLLNIALFVLN